MPMTYICEIRIDNIKFLRKSEVTLIKCKSDRKKVTIKYFHSWYLLFAFYYKDTVYIISCVNIEHLPIWLNRVKVSFII